MEGQSSIWEFLLWASPSSLLPPPQEAGECLSRLPRQFVLVISKHWALPHSLHSSNGQKPRPGLDQSPGLSAPELGKPVGNRTRPTWGRGTKTRLPSELHGSQRRFFIKKFPDLSLESEGIRSWDTESFGAPVPNSFLRGDQQFNSQQDPSPTLGLGAIPQLLPEASVETEEEMGEGRPWLKFSPLPLLIGHHLPAPARQSSRNGAQPVERRERAGGGLAGAAGARGWLQLSPPAIPPTSSRNHGDGRRRAGGS